MTKEAVPSSIVVCREVREALDANRPVVALESAVITHGLPPPANIEALRRMDAAVRESGSVPAVCLVSGGKLYVGAGMEMAGEAAGDVRRQKASSRDLALALAAGTPAGLTVSATLFSAHRVGIQVFATGGIGGVHRPATTGDVSADLVQLARSPVITVCSGAKSVLDIPRTVELLETLGVSVLGYRTNDFPGFYLTRTGIPIPRADSPRDVARIASIQTHLGQPAGMVIANPIPEGLAIVPDEWERWLASASRAAVQDGVAGKEVTPYLLDHVARASEGRTVTANLALLESNARLAGEIARACTE